MHSVSVPLQPIIDEGTEHGSVLLSMLRLDLIHPFAGGNKFFKLKYNLREAAKEGKGTIITFGGAWSNHIAATAAAGKIYGLETIGIIRGDELDGGNSTLTRAQDQGMKLHFVSRELYRNKSALMEMVNATYDPEKHFVIPEGGSNELGVKGCTEISTLINEPFDVICCACGTGATLAGIIRSLKPGQSALGFQVLKAPGYIKSEVEHWLGGSATSPWEINEEHHFGGYARYNAELQQFMKDFSTHHHMPLDFIYTAKMMFGIYSMIKTGAFPTGTRIIAVHTGGLQGNAGMASLLPSI
jgi:1-aminocyclopropane-1-carboxylate deaminase